MDTSTHRAHSTTPTPPEMLHRMLQHLRMHQRDSPEAHRQPKQESSNTSVATSYQAPTPTESIDMLKKELEALSKENQALKADLLAKDNELSQSQKEHRELKFRFEALKADAQKHKEQLISYNDYLQSMEKTIAHLSKENQDFAGQLGLMCDEHQGQLDKARKETEGMRQKHDRFLALLATLCYNETRRTLLRSTFLSMNVLVGLDEDELEQLFHFINFDDNVASNVVSTAD